MIACPIKTQIKNGLKNTISDMVKEKFTISGDNLIPLTEEDNSELISNVNNYFKDTVITDNKITLSPELVDIYLQKHNEKFVTISPTISDDGEVYTFAISRSGENVGYVKAINDGENLTVTDAQISVQGDGIGYVSYLKIADYAQSQNLTLVSDSNNRLSDKAKGLWEKLVRKGEARKTVNGYIKEKQTNLIKPGVSELFESNPELAQSVYEALGFEIPTTKLQGKQFEYGEPRFFDVVEELTSGERANLPSSILIKNLLKGEYLPEIKESQIILGLSEAGIWRPNLKKIEASGENKSTLSKKIGHELLHSVTNNIILSYQNLKGTVDFTDKYYKDFIKQGYIKPVNLSKSQIEALDNLVRIRNKVISYIEQNKDKIQKQDRGFGTYDYFIKTNYTESETDLHEFISEAFTNPELINILKEIPTEGKKSNLFKDFVDAIAKILGFTNTSILEDVIAYSEEAFFQQPQITPQQKQQAQQLYSQYLEQNPKGSVEGFKKWVNSNQSNVQYQLPQGREQEEYVASEKTIRDLAARMSDRIGIPVKYISDRSQQFKGKLEDNIAVINLAYATLDTPIHEVAGHSIIRALKLKSEKTIESEIDKMVEQGIIKKECQ